MYVEGNPVNFNDPLGLKTKYPHWHPHCQTLLKKINNIENDLEERWDEYDRNPGNLPERIGPGEKLSETRRGHITLINKESTRLDYWYNRYNEECEDDDGNSPPNCPNGNNELPPLKIPPGGILPFLMPLLLIPLFL